MAITARQVPKLLGAAILVAAALAAVLQPAGGGAPGLALPVLLAAIGLWAGGFLPEHVTALGFFTILVAAKLAPPEVVLSGFTSPSLWLALAGLIIGVAMEETGLGRRLGGVVSGLRHASYPVLAGAVVAVGLAAVFVMPSALGRMVLLIGIVAPMARHLGYETGGRGHTGLVLGGAFATFLPAFAVLPANVPNMILSGSLERVAGHGFTYGQYLALHFPVLGLLKAAFIWALVVFLYHDRPTRLEDAAALESKPISMAERRLALVLAVAVGLWVADSWHHVSPAWIGLGAAVLLMVPAFGVLGADAFRRINPAPLFHIAAVIGLGAVASHLGLGAWMAEEILGWMPLAGEGGVRDLAVLVFLSMTLGLLTTAPGVPAVLMPMAASLAARSGLSIDQVAMSQVLGFSNVLMPHQTPPLMAAAQVSGIAFHEFVRMCLLVALAGIVVLLPLDMVWWKVLGWL